jgi:hypothetical protein
VSRCRGVTGTAPLLWGHRHQVQDWGAPLGTVLQSGGLPKISSGVLRVEIYGKSPKLAGRTHTRYEVAYKGFECLGIVLRSLHFCPLHEREGETRVRQLLWSSPGSS